MKNVLQYTILGLLNENNLTGYEIYKEFNEVIGEIWSAKHSQVYNELKKLVNDNEIIVDNIDKSSKVEKKVYAITDIGKKNLYHWLESAVDVENTKDPFAIRVYFFEKLKINKKKEILVNKKEEKTKNLEELKTIYATLNKQDDLQHILILKKAILREEAYIEWLDFCLENV